MIDIAQDAFGGDPRGGVELRIEQPLGIEPGEPTPITFGDFPPAMRRPIGTLATWFQNIASNHGGIPGIAV